MRNKIHQDTSTALAAIWLRRTETLRVKLDVKFGDVERAYRTCRRYLPASGPTYSLNEVLENAVKGNSFRLIVKVAMSNFDIRSSGGKKQSPLQNSIETQSVYVGPSYHL